MRFTFRITSCIHIVVLALLCRSALSWHRLQPLKRSGHRFHGLTHTRDYRSVSQQLLTTDITRKTPLLKTYQHAFTHWLQKRKSTLWGKFGSTITHSYTSLIRVMLTFGLLAFGPAALKHRVQASGGLPIEGGKPPVSGVQG